MYKKEVPKLNKENFPTWKSLMKLHLGGLGDFAMSTMTTKFVEVTGVVTSQQMIEKKEYYKEMLQMAYALSYSEFDDIKECTYAK